MRLYANRTHYPTGSQTTAKNPLFSGVLNEGGTESGTLLANLILPSILSDADLQFVIANWAKLPEGIKSGILAIVNGSMDNLEPDDKNI